MFIAKADMLGSINENILDSVTAFDDTKLATAINFAVGLMSGHLNAKYDVTAIFAATGNARDPVILGYCIDITLFRLHNLISPRKIPKLRKDNYELALLWLNDVKEETISPLDCHWSKTIRPEIISKWGVTVHADYITNLIIN